MEGVGGKNRGNLGDLTPKNPIFNMPIKWNVASNESPEQIFE